MAQVIASKHKEQRIGVFVDVQNLYYSARALYKKKVNFNEVLQASVAGRKLIRAVAYVIKADILAKEKDFFGALEKFGYEVRAKDLQIFYGGAKKGDWDIGIAMDTIEFAPKLDTVVIVSGDGDFIPLVQHLKRAMSCKVELVAFKKSASSKLIEEADDFIDLEGDKKFLIS
ncbi:MAG: NYN domain-containing protein [Parcubacteria group bacterium]|nr:NYN domain-containing protein [Parcubacteria group bacterium]